MYIFVLGRDKDIAKLEIMSLIKANNLQAKLVESAQDFLVVEPVSNTADFEKYFSRLAGTIKVSKVLYETKDVDLKIFDNIDFYYPKNYTIFMSGLGREDLVSDLHQAAIDFRKQNKLKGSEQLVDENPLKPKLHVDKDADQNIDIQIIQLGDKKLISKTIWYTDTKLFQMMDEKRPVQKFSHGTSFRLARMMVNILGLAPNQVLVDPFCGIGTFLIEGLIAGQNVLGVDNDIEVFKGAKKNLEWAQQQLSFKSNYQILHEDSTTADLSADGCVFEPYMGPFLKKLPSPKEAKHTAHDLYTLYSKLFRNLNRYLSSKGKVVCIIPYFKTDQNERVEVNIDFFRQNGFQLVNILSEYSIDMPNPIEYDTPDGSRIMRRLYIVQKTN